MRHHQRPGDQRRRLPRPARLDRQAVEVDRPRRAAPPPDMAPNRRSSAASPSRSAAAAACRGPRASRPAAPAGAGRPASRRPRAVGRGSRFIPQATRSTVPNRLTSTGMPYAAPSSRLTFSNSTAGPPSASSRVWISVISRTGRHRLGDPDQPPLPLQPADELPQRPIRHLTSTPDDAGAHPTAAAHGGQGVRFSLLRQMRSLVPNAPRHVGGSPTKNTPK